MHKFNREQLNNDIVIDKTIRNKLLSFKSTWGLFSPKNIDEGSLLLLDNIEVIPGDNVLDIGCGYGALGLGLARDIEPGVVDMVDKDFVAIEYAQKNAEINNIKNVNIYLSNAFSKVASNKKYNVIVSNLPAKVGNELLFMIIHDAYSHLESGGRLYVVTISGLKEFIKRQYKEIFGNFKKVKQGKTYTVSMAVKGTVDE